MLLARWGEFFYMGRYQRLMGFAVSEGRWVRSGKIENVYSFGRWRTANAYIRCGRNYKSERAGIVEENQF
jgi:hypothetical protein